MFGRRYKKRTSLLAAGRACYAISPALSRLGPEKQLDPLGDLLVLCSRSAKFPGVGRKSRQNFA